MKMFYLQPSYNAGAGLSRVPHALIITPDVHEAISYARECVVEDGDALASISVIQQNIRETPGQGAFEDIKGDKRTNKHLVFITWKVPGKDNEWAEEIDPELHAQMQRELAGT